MSLRLEALRIAGTQVGVREIGRNSGPQVDAYLASVHLPPGLPWCSAFVHFCFEQAAAALGVKNTCPRTGGALRMHARSPAGAWKQIPAEGDVFVIDHGHGLGHVGFVESVDLDENMMQTIEGNSSGSGSREGDGVYRRPRRVEDVNLGFLRFTDAAT